MGIRLKKRKGEGGFLAQQTELKSTYSMYFSLSDCVMFNRGS